VSERWGWQVVEPGAPLRRIETVGPAPAAGEVLVEVAGCGVCHTDLGFLDGDVAPRAGLPLVLGHEITGRVIEAGEGAEGWMGRSVLVPAVIPCGDCAACRSGRGNTCARQCMPGNDRDGGFATHLTVPAVGLCPVDELPEGHDLADFAVIADAVTTPLQAAKRAQVGEGDLVVVVGAGGVGTHAVQIAAAFGALVVAIDVDDKRLQPLLDHGASAVVDATGLGAKQVRDRVREEAKRLGAPRVGWKVLECSGTAPGQESAFALLTSAGVLGIVGFTREPVTIRLSNLMAFDADCFGSWGCPVELYPEAVELARSGRIALKPFLRRMPLEDVAEALEQAHSPTDPRRIVLTP
jgi:6-hydroxycyclohex-1-ene-1-carbonyl-CoA dehydrogenase